MNKHDLPFFSSQSAERAFLPNAPQSVSGKRLEWAILTFLGLALLSLVVVYLIEPSIYASVLGLGRTPTERYPLGTTLFLLAIVGFVACVMGGVRHHWRWLFWLLLLAFASAILEIPATLLQLAGILPGNVPAWYAWYRIGIGLGEIGIAIWMVRVAMSTGVWGMGKQTRARTPACLTANAPVSQRGEEGHAATHERGSDA